MSEDAKQIQKDTEHHLNGEFGEGNYTLDYLSEDSKHIHFILTVDDAPSVTLSVKIEF